VRSKKALIWVILAVVAAILAGITAWLFHVTQQSAKAADALAASWQSLNEYYQRNPFPNATNVVLENGNVSMVRQWRQQTADFLAKDQLETPRKTPTTFQILFTEKRRALAAAARRNNVMLPEGFAFGFARYAEGGALPDSRDDLPSKLAEQLVLIERIATILFDARVSELTSIARDEYDIERGTDGGASSGGGGFGPAPRPRPGGAGSPGGASGPAAKSMASAYRKLHFVLEFKANEKALLGVLNRLAGDPVFIVVTGVEVERPAMEALGSAPAAPAGGATRADRIVCGQTPEDPSSVKLGLDVYRF